MSGVSLQRLRAAPGVVALRGDAGVTVRGVQSDSRRVEPGDLFAAVPGGRVDGARFAAAAVERGARAVLASRPLDLGVPVLQSDDVRRSLGPVAHAVYGAPTHGWPVVGITGTNGKTTVAYLLESVLRAAWGEPAVLGTVSARGPAGAAPSALTTPEADEIARFARRQRDAGASALVMEVSSHALAQHRADGVRFEVAAFTNLSQDHLDYHGDLASYGEAKARLFTELAPAHSVVMCGGAFGRGLSQRAAGRLWRCSLDATSPDEVRALAWSSARDGIRARVATPAGEVELTSPLLGAHNVENLLVAIGVCLALGVDLSVCVDALRTAQGAPGRMERVPHPADVAVLVDYAHTPAALERALEALRPLTRGRLWAVCGCGGDRDKQKRAPMGEVAVRGADLAILTSDNPRSEEPAAIVAEMEQGARRAGAPRLAPGQLSEAARGYAVTVDRAAAIQQAIDAARPGDTVLIAGKGHEDYQILGAQRVHFDDREQARAAIARAFQGRG